MAINVKRIDLVQRFKDRDVLKAPRTILDQVYINDTQKDDGTIEKGIEDTPAFIYNGKKPNNLNEALKNLAENVKGSIGASGVLQIKRGASGTPEDPDLSGIYTMPEAGNTDLGIVTLAKIKDLADEVDAAKDATRATVANKILTGVKADGTGEYYDLGTQMKNPASNKAFQGFEGGDITKPMWLEVKSTVAPAPFTGSTTIAGETYSSSDIGVASEFFYKLFKGNQLAIVESDTLTPTSDNKYYAEWGGGANDAVTITIPKAEGKVKDVLINNTSIVDTDGKAKITVKDTYDATGTDAISGKGVSAALDTLDVAEVGQAGKYIQKIKQEDGKIVTTLSDVKDTYTATDLEPISGKGVADALSDLELEETGGTDKIITMVKQEDGKVTATAKTAVEKVTTPATTNAYEYKIADASVKVELPKATDTAYGEILLDKDKIDSASTAKTDDPKLMTGKAIEDSLAVKKVNGNASIYAYNANVPAVDNAIALGAGASVTAAGGVAVGANASTASADDVAIGSGASTASNASIAVGKSAATTGDSSIAIGQSSSAAAVTAIAAGYDAQAKLESAVAIGRGSIANGKYAVALGRETNVSGESSIAIGKSSTTNGTSTIAIGETAVVAGQSAMAIGKGASAEATNTITIGTEAQAQKEGDIAIGTDTTTDGKYAVAIGSNADAEGESAIAIGKDTEATNEQAIAIGKTSATGKKSINIGNNNETISEGSAAIGDTLQANNSWETALGTYNRSVEDDDTIVGTAFTIGRGYPVDGEDPVLYNLIEQKQNADLYIPGIGGFDGKNSDPYDYELDDDGNPKINNDGNPIKKVRPLQESIVEDVVMLLPTDGGGGVVLDSWEEVPSDGVVINIFSDLYDSSNTRIILLDDIPSTAPSIHVEGNIPDGYQLEWMMYLTMEGDKVVEFITQNGPSSQPPYSNPCDIPFNESLLSMIGMTYPAFIEQIAGMGGKLGIGIVGDSNVAAVADALHITMGGGGQPMEDYVVSSGDTWSHTTGRDGSEGLAYVSQYISGYTEEIVPKIHVTGAGNLLSQATDDLYVYITAIINGNKYQISDQYGDIQTLLDMPNPNDFTLPANVWPIISQQFPSVDYTTIQVAFAFEPLNDQELDMSGITYEFISQRPKVNLEPKSIVKAHIATLPFIDQIEPDSNDYDVPNVKAAKQQRKEIEDEFVFIKGNAHGSIKAKDSNAIADGTNAFATPSYSMTVEGGGTILKESTASGVSSVAMIGGTASGEASFAIQTGKASGLESIAMGFEAIASGHKAIAIGAHAKANTDESVAIGISSKTNGPFSLSAGNYCVASGSSSIAIGYDANALADDSISIGSNTRARNKYSCAIGTSNITHDQTNNELDDSTQFAIGLGHSSIDSQHPSIYRNLQEATYDGKLYVYGIGGYDGIASDATKWGIYKKNADGTDYINPLTNKKEHEYYKPLQEVIELMDARIKYLEDIIEQLTQQRNPVEP